MKSLLFLFIVVAFGCREKKENVFWVIENPRYDSSKNFSIMHSQTRLYPGDMVIAGMDTLWFAESKEDEFPFPDQRSGPSVYRIGDNGRWHDKWFSDSVMSRELSGIFYADSGEYMTDKSRHLFAHLNTTGYITLVTFSKDTLTIDSKYPQKFIK